MNTHTGQYPAWLEFFLHNPSVDDLNMNSPTIIGVGLSVSTTTPFESFANASLFTDYCAIAVSSLNQHIWFAHHFHQIGNLSSTPELFVTWLLMDWKTTLNSASWTLWSVSQPNILKSPFSKISSNFIDGRAQPTSPPAAAEHEAITVNGIIFLPHFLLDDIGNLQTSNISQIYLQASQSIQSYVTKDAPDSEMLAKTALKWSRSYPSFNGCGQLIIISSLPLLPKLLWAN
jgi:hypothetical protein